MEQGRNEAQWVSLRGARSEERSYRSHLRYVCVGGNAEREEQTTTMIWVYARFNKQKDQAVCSRGDLDRSSEVKDKHIPSKHSSEEVRQKGRFIIVLVIEARPNVARVHSTVLRTEPSTASLIMDSLSPVIATQLNRRRPLCELL